MERGAVWLAELPGPNASGPGYRRPYVIVSANAFNQSRIRTVIAVVLTSNLRISDAPGNVSIAAADSGLPKDAVANVAQIIMMEKRFLVKRCSRLPSRTMKTLDNGLRLVLGL
jgi:mRNA interferase MazF